MANSVKSFMEIYIYIYNIYLVTFFQFICNAISNKYKISKNKMIGSKATLLVNNGVI